MKHCPTTTDPRDIAPAAVDHDGFSLYEFAMERAVFARRKGRRCPSLSLARPLGVARYLVVKNAGDDLENLVDFLDHMARELWGNRFYTDAANVLECRAILREVWADLVSLKVASREAEASLLERTHEPEGLAA